MSVIVKRYIDYMKFAACMAIFIPYFLYCYDPIVYHIIYGCIFCMFMFNSVNCVLL